MTTPVLFVLAGPNGAGKSTLYEKVLEPIVDLEFVNADRIAKKYFPGTESQNGYEAARLAAERRQQLLDEGRSFIAETVFSHESKIDLMRGAVDRGYRVELHVVLIPEELAVARVANRVENGGHEVPEDKIRGRYERLWKHVRDAIKVAHRVVIYDNSSADAPLRKVATYTDGALDEAAAWPAWTPAELR